MEESKVTVSVTRKANLGNFESADVFLSLSLPVGATQADIDAGLETGALMYKSLAAAVNEKIKEMCS